MAGVNWASGLGAKDLLEPAYGLPYPPPITHLREYLGVLRPLLDGARTGYRGATVTSHPFGATAVAGAEQAIPVVVAAMGPQALRITGEFADGTLPFLAGPRRWSSTSSPCSPGQQPARADRHLGSSSPYPLWSPTRSSR